MGTFIQFVLATGASLSDDYQSPAVRLEKVDNCAVQAVFTGSSPTGTFKLQVSNDKGSDPGVNPATGITNWTDVANSSQDVTASGDILWNVEGIGFRWLRVVYTRTSGSGTVTITIQAKGFS